MKRFTDTEIWKKPWFRKLAPRAKCLWRYLCDNCDHAGVLDPDWEAISFQIGEPVSNGDLEGMNGNVVQLNGKLFIPQYIEFQYGKLNSQCKPHRPVFEALERHGISLSMVYRRAMDGIQEPYERLQEKEKEEEKDKDKEKDIELPHGFPKTESSAIAAAMSVGCPEDFVRKTWTKAMGRGGRDAKGVAIASWAHHLATEWSYQREAGSRAQVLKTLSPGVKLGTDGRPLKRTQNI